MAQARRTRRGVGALGLALAACVAVLSVARSGEPRALAAAAGVLGWCALALAVARASPASVAAGVFLLGVSYAAALLLRSGALDPLAPAVAGGLFAAAELVWWSASANTVREERSLRARRLVIVGVAGLAAGGVGALVLAAADFAFGGGVALEAAGVAAAVLAVGVVVATAVRGRRTVSPARD